VPSDPGLHLQTEGPQALRHPAGRPLLLSPQFRVTVKVLPEGHQIIVEIVHSPVNALPGS
jgi:hypothetical protein